MNMVGLSGEEAFHKRREVVSVVRGQGFELVELDVEPARFLNDPAYARRPSRSRGPGRADAPRRSRFPVTAAHAHSRPRQRRLPGAVRYASYVS
ncbi:hypothetical protein ACF08M_08475 [Streptomyces sp. NPDC015032]|uniref:hypothetical protein n=1 Tax=Streptomyces sp. NPDC015032 TaxID=3364937 RepID=UPI0036FDC62E